jgi:hypothetical protein
MTKAPDFDIRTLDLAQFFAPFGRRQMPDKAIWLLSLASSVLPEGNIGAEIWLSRVAGVTVHDRMMREWGRGLADAFGKGEFKPMRGKRRRAMFAEYQSRWGHAAADDGMRVAIHGQKYMPCLRARGREFDCYHEGYGRMLELVKDFALMQAGQYDDALRWAVRACRMGEIDIDALTSASAESVC